MQLITALLVVVAILTILTGVAILCGSTRQSRTHAVWFFLSTFGAAIWSVAIAIFCVLPQEYADMAPMIVTCIIAGITLTDVALLGYTCWNEGAKGKATTLGFLIFGAALVGLLAASPELFYSEITFSASFNQLHVVHGWYFYVIIAFFTVISLVYSAMLTQTIKRARSHGVKTGLKIFQVGLSIGGILALVFDLILITAAPNLVWIGPMATSVSIIAFYYSVVKYRIIAISGRWMEIMSYIVIAVTGGVGYMVVFYALFTALFKVPNPSSSVLILNMLMAMVLLCMMPALHELISIAKSHLPTRQIDVGYIVKKFNKLAKYDVDAKELASFLAMTLKFEQVSFLINGRLYESKPSNISAAELESIKKLKVPKVGIWQDCRKAMEGGEKLSGVAVLKNNKGEVYGQVILGRQVARRILEKGDLIEIEMVLKLTGILLDEHSKIKTRGR